MRYSGKIAEKQKPSEAGTYGPGRWFAGKKNAKFTEFIEAFPPAWYLSEINEALIRSSCHRLGHPVV